MTKTTRFSDVISIVAVNEGATEARRQRKQEAAAAEPQGRLRFQIVWVRPLLSTSLVLEAVVVLLKPGRALAIHRR